MKDRKGEWVMCGGIRMFMYIIDAPNYTHSQGKIRPKLNFKYKAALSDNKVDEQLKKNKPEEL